MFNTIVWATDGSQAADEALPYVKTLAGTGASVVVVHAVESFVTGYSAGLPEFGDEDELKAKIERQVEQLRSEGVSADTTILHAHAMRPAHLIAEAARDAGADVVVVGTRGHTPLGGLLLGGVTQRLLHTAPCPVFAVPPKSRASENGAASLSEAQAPRSR
jgi:nucleotide-binding universal stress UspA family protein